MSLKYQKAKKEEIIEFYKKKGIKTRIVDDVILLIGKGGYKRGKLEDYYRCCFSNHIFYRGDLL